MKTLIMTALLAVSFSSFSGENSEFQCEATQGSRDTAKSAPAAKKDVSPAGKEVGK